MVRYAIRREVDATYEEVLERLPEALKSEGFGVLTEIDVKETMKKKLDVDYRKYKILGACNPPFAKQALDAELDIGVLLPCNVVVWEKDDGKAMISAMDPVVAMGAVVDNPKMGDIAKQVRDRIVRAIERV